MASDPYPDGIARARAALGRPHPRPRVVPDLEPEVEVAAPADDVAVDERDERIAALEAENRALRRTLDRIRDALDS